MNNLKKIGLTALAGSLATFSATAAEFSVSGSASLTFDNPDRTGLTNGNPYSMGDSLGFNASGETDGGLGVAVYYEIDQDDMDDYDMTISGDFGSIKFHGSGGSTAFGAVDDVTPNAYEEAWDIIDTDGAATSGSPTVIGGGSGANMFVYTSPDFGGAVLTAAVVPSGNAAGADTYTDFALAISPEAVEGLTLGYAISNNTVSNGTVDNDKSTMYAKYAVGAFTVGVQAVDADHDTATSGQESMAYGVTYAVNDDFSIGYSYHELEFDKTSLVDQESTGISASYTMGGMTLAGAMNEVDGMDGTATQDNEGYEFNLKFAF